MRAFLGILFASILVSGCTLGQGAETEAVTGQDCPGVTVVVDFGPLADNPGMTCVEVPPSGAIAGDVLATAGYTTEGTQAYGDLVVCRVNGLPSSTEPLELPGEDPHRETCAEMPPAFAYWALWQKSAPSEPWGYAQEGVRTLTLGPGMSIGLVFSTGGDTPTPDGAPG